MLLAGDTEPAAYPNISADTGPAIQTATQPTSRNGIPLRDAV